MEYCEIGDLYSYIYNKEFKLSEKEASNISKQILSGLYYLHQYGVAHRDIKPENILVKKVEEKLVFKIADFGLSRIILPDEVCSEPYGTLVSILF